MSRGINERLVDCILILIKCNEYENKKIQKLIFCLLIKVRPSPSAGYVRKCVSVEGSKTFRILRTQTCSFISFCGWSLVTVAHGAKTPHSCHRKQKQTLSCESPLPRSAAVCERAFDRPALTAVRERHVDAVGGE